MKKVILLILLIISLKSFGQSVTISPSNNSPMINASGTTNGILIPRMTQTQRMAILSPAAGLLVYQTDGTVGFYVQKSSLAFATNWELISEGRNFLDTSLSNGDDIYTTNTGRVGIGTPNPSEKLTVQTGTGYGISHTNGSTTVSTYVSSVAGWLGTKSAHPLYFYTNSGISQMTLSTAGNVGIGTTSPNAPLQFSNAAVNRKVVLYDVSNNDHQYYGFGINGSTLRYQVDAPSSNHIFYSGTSSSTSNELIRIQGNGNVGIGTNSPNYILDINGRTRIRHNGSTAGLWFNKSDNSEGAFTGMYDNNIYGFFGMGTVSNWKFAFDLVNTKMGIGSFSPKHPLTFSSNVGDKISFWGGETAETDNHYGIGVQGSVLQLFVPTATENIVFGTGRSGLFNEKMRINGGGNVGIGINNPTSTLAVARGTGLNGTAAFFGTTHTSHFNYSTTEDTYIRGGKNNSKVLINDLASLGNVGIGTASPDYKLQVNTTGNSAGIVHSDNTGIQVGTYVGSGAGWYGTLSNHPLALFVNNGGPAITLTTSEQLQVGGSTTPSGFKMSVDGKLLCTELEVLVTPWPDYVFGKNYQLKPLLELENFIEKNGHLPNIPKAEDIEKQSLALGNMATLQMEKIEELTLYIIEINKRLQKVEEENKALTAEIKIVSSKN